MCFVMPDELQQLASEINLRLKQETKCRIGAALMLQAARKLVEERGEGWQAWCEAHIERSFRDVQRLLLIAQHSNPEEALEKERATNRAAKERSRSSARDSQSPNSKRKASTRRKQKGANLAAVKRCVLRWAVPDRQRLRNWLEELLDETPASPQDEARH